MKNQPKKLNQVEQLKNGIRVHANNLPSYYHVAVDYQIQQLKLEDMKLNPHAQQRQSERVATREDMFDVLLKGYLIEIHIRNNTRTVLKSYKLTDTYRLTVAFDLETKTITTMYYNDLEQIHKQNKKKYLAERLNRSKQVDRLLLGLPKQFD